MDNIFDSNNLYPGYDNPLKEYFKDYFDSVFICFSPFFKLKNGTEEYTSLQQAKVISLEELQKNNDAFKNLDPNVERVIYTNNNSSYPQVEEIIDNGTPIKWQYVLEHTPLKNFSEINLALCTSIGALGRDFRRIDLQQKLNAFAVSNSIYYPTEGRITALSLIRIYNCLKTMGKVDLVITDEFFQDRKVINLITLPCVEFVLLVRGYMYFFPIDRTLLFTIEWDSFYFLICGNQVLLDEIIPKFEFEGFFSSNETIHNWYSNEEI
ncbi:DUF2711 family protein [Mucilaginibacter polytrichastri]|uniref:Uncharacterized protein n=1 Tax=Mucilaginibacter polytrichastri TaxID=1302689 RepID=A0A1Q6A5E3_9SPHI|nr:DUF2711 family protein [Mucilaginibacter polytrichastri]OKS89216.1 hypothetical protein RG47T_4698 [Mucilaginibacter polytrichastri]SFS98131.1 Protein of unknown function [Mucilaginibacter polytrichastri]